MSKTSGIRFDAEFGGKRALITGGTKGVGEAVVRRLAAAGATVATTARSPLPEGQAAALFVQADISTRAGVDEVVWQVLNQFGSLDILIHNAGGSAAQAAGHWLCRTRIGSMPSTQTCSQPSVWIALSFQRC